MVSDELQPEKELESSEVEAETHLDYEPDDELGDVGALKAKLKKQRDELTQTKKEKAEYLEGWQRAKAEMVNSRRESEESVKRAGLNSRLAFFDDLLPAIDSFDMAMMGDGWQKVDAAWRTGVESIRQQIAGTLQSHGIESFGALGEKYDPQLHETAQEIEGGVSGTVAKILRKGFKTKDFVIRPAHVVLYK